MIVLFGTKNHVAFRFVIVVLNKIHESLPALFTIKSASIVFLFTAIVLFELFLLTL